MFYSLDLWTFCEKSLNAMNYLFELQIVIRIVFSRIKRLLVTRRLNQGTWALVTSRSGRVCPHYVIVCPQIANPVSPLLSGFVRLFSTIIIKIVFTNISFVYSIQNSSSAIKMTNKRDSSSHDLKLRLKTLIFYIYSHYI